MPVDSVPFKVGAATDITASRELNTIYQNTTGKPINVVIEIDLDQPGHTARIFIGPTSPPTLIFDVHISYQVNDEFFLSALVPAGWYYELFSGDPDVGILNWYEQPLG